MIHFKNMQYLRILPLLVLIAMTACKKESKPATVVTDPGYAQWLQTTAATGQVKRLLPANDRLYFTTSNGSYNRLLAINPDGSVTTLANPPMGSVIRDMAIFDGRLFYAGTIPTADGNHLFALDLSTYFTEGFDLPTGAGQGINALQPYAGKLAFCGNFGTSTFITTAFMDALNTAGETTGMHGILNPPNGMCIGNGDLYAFGKQLTASPNSSGIARRNGTQWYGIPYSGMAETNIIRSLEVIQDTMYMTWQETDAAPYRFSRVVNGISTPVTGISVSANGRISVRWINGSLYAFGQGLSAGDQHTNVFRKSGNNWIFDRTISETINDLAWFNGHLYAATPNGIWKD